MFSVTLLHHIRSVRALFSLLVNCSTPPHNATICILCRCEQRQKTPIFTLWCWGVYECVYEDVDLECRNE